MKISLRAPTFLRLFALCLLLPALSLRAQEEGNRFGVIEGFWLPDEVCELGVGWERIIFDWAQHQPNSPDEWFTLNVDDRWLKQANNCNREVVAIIKHTPDWATDGLPGPGVPRGLYLPVDDPENTWATFIRRAASYYASRGVRRFILWNEPDIDRETYGFEFEGTLEDYYQMVRVGYLAAKEGNPAAIIHLAGTTYWHDVNEGRRPYAERLIERIIADPEAAANNYYFDVLTLHIYFRSETVYDITREMRQMLDRFGLHDKSIWIGETNASPNLDPLWPVVRPNWQISLEQQASFLVQAAALGLASGADHIGAFKFYDWALPPGAESFGLLRADASRRPAFAAWQMVASRFNNVTSAALARGTSADVVRLTHDNGQVTYVAWARTAEAALVQIEAAGDKAQLLDEYGTLMTLHPLNGVYTLALPGAVCNSVDGCPVGGAVSLLVQPEGRGTIVELTPAGGVPLVFEEEQGLNGRE